MADTDEVWQHPLVGFYACLIATGPIRMVFMSSCGESLCLSGLTPMLPAVPKDPALGRAALHHQKLRREGAVSKREGIMWLMACSFLFTCCLWWSYKQHHLSMNVPFPSKGSWFPAPRGLQWEPQPSITARPGH